MKEQMREAFQAWWGQAPIELEPLKPRSIDENVSVWAWQAWQAALSAVPAQEPVIANLKNAVATVLEGWTLPDGVRKILETAYFQEPVKQESWISVDDVQSLVDASDILMKWLVKNVHQWNFSEYDWLSAATERVKASLPPVKEVTG